MLNWLNEMLGQRVAWWNSVLLYAVAMKEPSLAQSSCFQEKLMSARQLPGVFQE